MSMDARDNFPVDMVEQMLKFTPTPEERALLDEHADEMEHLARADRFLFELSKITHYEQVKQQTCDHGDIMASFFFAWLGTHDSTSMS